MRRTRVPLLSLVPLLALGSISGALACATAGPAAQTGAAAVVAGTGSYVFDATPATAARPVRVWYHRPASIDTDAPIVLVMHGAGRNGDGYRDAWIDEAERYGFLLVVPEFSDEHYPGAQTYNLGNVFDDDDAPVPEAQWSYSAVEPIFDDARARFGNRSSTYAIYGHSAGSQFVHRFLMLKPDARVSHAVLANAGWYTMPHDSAAWPYGAAGLERLPGVDPNDAVRSILTRPATVLLGTADTLRTDNFRTTPEADAQGRSRFERGHGYFDSARRAAARLGVPFRWELRTVDGVGHSNGRMAPAAARALADALGWVQ